jgi:putative transposase
MIYHALNRANFRSRLFRTDAHYPEFLDVLEESLSWAPMRILAYGLMPNHWHLVLQPRGDGDLSRFLQLLTVTPTQRYHARTRTVGYGHLYQGRYKSFPGAGADTEFWVSAIPKELSLAVKFPR